MENDNKNFKTEMSIVDLFHIFIKNIWIVILSSSVFVIISVIYAWVIITPDYISGADVMVQVEQDSSNSNDLNFDLVNAFRLIDTLAELMEKDIILNNAIKKLEMQGYQDLSASDLRSGLVIRSSSSSYFINISYIDENKALASATVDAIIEAVIEETDVADAFPVLANKIRRTSYASEAEYNSPNKILITFGGLILGLILSVGFIVSREALSTHFKSKEEIEKVLNFNVIGLIPLMDSKEINNGKKKR